MALLSAADFNDILALLSPDLSADDVSPSILASNAFFWSAEQEVLAIDPLAEERTGNDYLGVVQAARCFAAARLALTLTDVVSERFPVYSIQTINPDREKQAASLRLDAYRYLAHVLGLPLIDVLTGNLSGGTRPPTAFTRAPGNHGAIDF